VNPILRDRMYRIMTKGYDAKEKLVIARDFLLPKIRDQVAFKDDELIIPDATLTEIIGNESITAGEEGVRNLKRCLEIIHTKLNLFRLMKPEKNIFAKHLDLEITFPITVTNEHVKKLIDCTEPSQSFLAMYV
jgi:Lon-like ATP-dependent protease